LAYFLSVAAKSRKSVCSQVAKLLKAERQRQNLSMTVVAARAGLSQQSVSYLEREMRIPTLDTLLRVADVLNIALEDVIAEARKSAKK
jgi:transcriptional regulator with XRE-family HTH domain